MSFPGGSPDASNTTHLAPSFHERAAEGSAHQHGIDSGKLVSMMAVSLSLASVSVLAALIVFYMFVRMRRAFQHDLIMLLIQSDMMKAFWLVVCPLVYFIHGPVDPSGIFCQVSGFFLSASIEAADIAVLMIAMHTALALMRPQSPSGETGLYPYRRCAYLCWAVVPLVLAGVVPLTGAKFVDDGANCYLPTNPAWYRLMLSWVPRYIIFFIILLTYVGIYAYVRFQLARFCRDQRRASYQSATSATAVCFCEQIQHRHYSRDHRHHTRYRFLHSRSHRRQKRRSTLPATPPIARHGLLDTNADSTDAPQTTEDPRERQISAGSTITNLKLDAQQQPSRPEPARLPQAERISWRAVDFVQQNASPDGPPQPTLSRTDTERTATTARVHPNVTPALTSRAAAQDGAALSEAALSPRTSLAPSCELESSTTRTPPPLWRRSLNHTASGARRVVRSLYDIVDILRFEATQRAESGDNLPATAEPEGVYLPTDEAEEAMRRSRDRMQRQLRLLSVYPAVYVLTWIAPLVAHATGFDSVFGRQSRYWEEGLPWPNGNRDGGPMAGGAGTSSPRFELEIATLVSLCIGAAVDCCFFSAWEKPWRHARRPWALGFLGGLAALLHIPIPVSTSSPGSPPTDTDGQRRRRRSLLTDCDFLSLSHRRADSGGSYDGCNWIGLRYGPGFRLGLGLGRRVRPGRTREEQNRDARLAHHRRDQEALDRTERARERQRERAATASSRGGAGSPAGAADNGSAVRRGVDNGGRTREWWDAIDVDVESEDEYMYGYNSGSRGHGNADTDPSVDRRSMGGGGAGVGSRSASSSATVIR